MPCAANPDSPAAARRASGNAPMGSNATTCRPPSSNSAAGDRGPPRVHAPRHWRARAQLPVRRTAQLAAEERPCSGCSPLDWMARRRRCGRSPSMAARYAHDIRAICPDGPYLLAGGSMGGLLALEVARRLGTGSAGASVWMFDTYGPGMEHPLGESPWRPHRWWSLYRGLDADQRAWVHGRVAFRLWRLPTMRLRKWLSRGRSVPQALRIHEIERSQPRGDHRLHDAVLIAVTSSCSRRSRAGRVGTGRSAGAVQRRGGRSDRAAGPARQRHRAAGAGRAIQPNHCATSPWQQADDRHVRRWKGLS